jgi:hypothetical protein
VESDKSPIGMSGCNLQQTRRARWRSASPTCSRSSTRRPPATRSTPT